MNAYVRSAGSSALQGLSTGLWVAAGELSPGRRRLARLGVVAVTAAAFSAGSQVAPPPEQQDEERERPSFDKRSLIVLGAGLACAVAGTVGGRLLERRWLARLERKGHPHPHRALGLRLGAISGATALAGDVARLKA